MAKKPATKGKGPTESFDKDLFVDAQEAADVEQLWAEGRDVQREDQPVGTFQVEVTDAVLERSQSSDRRQIHYEMVILAGQHKDVILNKYDGLETPQQISITQSQLGQLGVDITAISFADIPATLLTLMHTKIVVRARQNGQYYNIYFQRPLTPMPKTKGVGKKRPAAKPATRTKAATTSKGRQDRTF